MIRPLFLFRPEPGWSESAARAREMGLTVLGEPLFIVEPVTWEAPDPARFDAALVGSANVFRHGGAGLSALRSLAVHCVGETTAQAARDAGFTVASVGRGGLQGVVDALPGGLHLLRLAGEAHVALEFPADSSAETRIVYRSRGVWPGAETLTALHEGGVVALHSGEAARHFSEIAEAAAIRRDNLALVALGPRIAASAGSGWQSIHIAERPDEGHLLAMAKQMCHTLR